MPCFVGLVNRPQTLSSLFPLLLKFNLNMGLLVNPFQHVHIMLTIERETQVLAKLMVCHILSPHIFLTFISSCIIPI